jgi:hypothetical protein
MFDFSTPSVAKDFSDDVDQSHPYSGTGLDDQALADAAADHAHECWLDGTTTTIVEDAPTCRCCGRESSGLSLFGTPMDVCDDCLAREVRNAVGPAKFQQYAA